MEFRICKFEDKNLIIIQHEEQTIGAIKLEDIKDFLNDKNQNVKFLNDEMNK
ncbi:hypothetical protein HYH38_16100 [Clostridium botulinum]|uniref:hypothetical protein n=1 Tax=Clostridium TaxID=1485 RepID=UPI00155DC64E|nr:MULTISPECIES: hypothetical protein [Clostridium]MBY6810986.1 hypothetical protein [Clostridium botulinum]MBY6818463.1 hypothetical protein [Clostridium botulinum]MBY6824454.1 hypothetical protein [Clostridium botulinum]MBY6828757.1 hypothetical protein [Clostridium botulinum]MBY6832686.1 hypothetical protein [Clostridium botulinum]